MNFFNFGEKINRETRFVIFGVPWDYLSSTDLPNSSTSPETIRNLTEDIGYTTELGFVIPDIQAVRIRADSQVCDKYKCRSTRQNLWLYVHFSLQYK